MRIAHVEVCLKSAARHWSYARERVAELGINDGVGVDDNDRVVLLERQLRERPRDGARFAGKIAVVSLEALRARASGSPGRLILAVVRDDDCCEALRVLLVQQRPHA